MTNPWTHDEVRAELGAYSLDALSPDESAAIDAHLSTCDSCRAELRAMREAAASLSAMAPTRIMDPDRSAGIRQRLLDRAQRLACLFSYFGLTQSPEIRQLDRLSLLRGQFTQRLTNDTTGFIHDHRSHWIAVGILGWRDIIEANVFGPAPACA